MNAGLLMLAVAGCYTITSLGDKYAVAKDNVKRNEFTFLMCASMAVFVLVTLPFTKVYGEFSWQTVLGIVLVALCKLGEYQASALVLVEISAFELKAWLAINLFFSYFVDILYGEFVNFIKIICIVVTTIGLFLVVKSGEAGKKNYKKIIVPLVIYLASKLGYGLVIKHFSEYCSSSIILICGLAIVALIMLLKVNPVRVVRDNRKAAGRIIILRIPNAAGMLMENALIAISITSYSFVQPMILVALFAIGLFRKEHCSKLNIIGSILCLASIVIFQII